jgi:hypothetical protein
MPIMRMSSTRHWVVDVRPDPQPVLAFSHGSILHRSHRDQIVADNVVVMLIRSVSRGDLDQFLPHCFAIGRFIGAKAEWFADRAGIASAQLHKERRI